METKDFWCLQTVSSFRYFSKKEQKIGVLKFVPLYYLFHCLLICFIYATFGGLEANYGFW